MLRSTQRKAVVALAAVTLTSSFGVLANFANAAPAPTGVAITGLSVAKGATTATTSTLITGTGFLQLEKPNVKFGGADADKLIVLSDTQIAAVAPTATAGKVDVLLADDTVVYDALTGTAAAKDDFTYITPYNATVTAGSLMNSLGGSKLTVTSSASVGATAAEFTANKVTATVGGVVAPVAYVDSTTVQLTVPAGTPSATAPKVVLLHDGVPGTAATNAKYAAVVGGIDKPVGSVAGGENVVITGKGLKGATKWTFGTVEVASADCTAAAAPADDTKVTCKVPGQGSSFTGGAVSVTFTPATGLVAGTTSKATYTYSDLG